jgi:hypothetical protein
MTSSEHEPTGPDERADEQAGQRADERGQEVAPEQAEEPLKPHGDPLFNEAEGEHGPADVPEVGKGTATSAASG